MRNLEIKNNDCHAALAMTKSVQNGRSMIEMLGVLAIIGVLSVGGIAGYSKAMQKYRINKAIEQITLIAGNVRSFFAPQRSYVGVDCDGENCYASGCQHISSVDGETGKYIGNAEYGCPTIKKAKILPDEMTTVTDGKIMSITNPFGGRVVLRMANKAQSHDYQAFYIKFSEIESNEDTCIELLSHDWTSANIGYISIDANGPSSHRKNIKNIPVSIDTAVSACDDVIAYSKQYAKNFSIYFYFDVDLGSDYYKDYTWTN